MEKVETGMFVSVDYKGSYQNGDVFDSSQGRDPIEVQIGAGQVIKGFENALMGMSLHEKKTFTLEAVDAYGFRDENLIRVFARTDFPPDIDPQIGQLVGLTTPEGQQVPALVTQLDEENVTLDMNHPLAGEALTFEIQVVGISDSPTQKPTDCGDGCDCSSGCS